MYVALEAYAECGLSIYARPVKGSYTIAYPQEITPGRQGSQVKRLTVGAKSRGQWKK